MNPVYWQEETTTKQVNRPSESRRKVIQVRLIQALCQEAMSPQHASSRWCKQEYFMNLKMHDVTKPDVMRPSSPRKMSLGRLHHGRCHEDVVHQLMSRRQLHQRHCRHQDQERETGCGVRAGSEGRSGWSSRSVLVAGVRVQAGASWHKMAWGTSLTRLGQGLEEFVTSAKLDDINLGGLHWVCTVCTNTGVW